ncbi:hypothetical protein HK104_005588 [Borealophlyctis nickersoniae]|nr:hypothetical protein HK104_005588 [Borealophlyctis nickersoniae]
MYNFDLLRRLDLVNSIEQTCSRFVPIMRYVYFIAFILTNVGNFLYILKYTDHDSLPASICAGVQIDGQMGAHIGSLTRLDQFRSTVTNAGGCDQLKQTQSQAKLERVGRRADMVRQLKAVVYLVTACDVAAIIAFLIGMKVPQYELEFTQFAAGAYVGHALFGIEFLAKLRDIMDGGDASPASGGGSDGSGGSGGGMTAKV